ncbi:protein Teyrha-meyrha isoform X2 [Drosophila tropicalis]|uniref:protein Teyrha-meyrha isoform X2 n=1 Tax=Drosophila tropicalis TaxID=46794 RepID=UPI0035ABF962
MENNAFGNSHLPSQALVVLSEAASGLHEALRGQRPFPARLPDAKDLHNMSLVSNYGTHLLHNFHPHLLQTLNHGMLAANGAAAAAAAAAAASGGVGPTSYFASSSERKPSVLTNFSLPSAFSPPKYIGISLDQNLFNGSESFRTDSASPTCTSHESMEGSQDYDAIEKGESPRSNNSQDPRDLRHLHGGSANKGGHNPAAVAAAAAAAASSSAASSSSSSSCSTSSSLAISTAATTMATHHLTSPHHSHPAHPAHSHPHAHSHAHAHAHHGHIVPTSTHHHMVHPHPHSLSHHHAAAAHHAALASLSMAGLRAVPGGLSLVSGLQAAAAGGAIPDMCPVCGLKLSAEEWHTHFLTELDRLYKLSSGFERANLQATYMFAPPCPAQENAIRTSHNRWETFQRIRNNRQNRLRLKVRKRKYGEMYMMESLYCSSCPICKRKYALETGKIPPEDDSKMQEEIETVDVESCNDDVPDSGSELAAPPPPSLAVMPQLPPPSSSTSSNSNSMHNSNAQPGKLDGILYRTACVINQKDEQDVSTNVTTASSITSSWQSSSSSSGQESSTSNSATISAPQAHISVKNVSELSSTTHHYYNADSCGGGVGGGVTDNGSINSQQNNNGNSNKELMMDTASCQNDSDEDVIVDDDETTTTMKMTTSNKQATYAKVQQRRQQEETTIGSSRSMENISPMEERPRSEPQVSSTEPGPMDITHNNNNININNNSSAKYGESMDNSLTQLSSMGVSMPGLTQLDTKTGIKDLNTDAFLRGRNFYFHQSCANVMSSYRLNKELLNQQQQAQQRTAAGVGGGGGAASAGSICPGSGGGGGGDSVTPRSLSPAQSPQQSVE